MRPPISINARDGHAKILHRPGADSAGHDLRRLRSSQSSCGDGVVRSVQFDRSIARRQAAAVRRHHRGGDVRRGGGRHRDLVPAAPLAARDLGKHVKRRAVKVALTVDADDATLADIVEVLQPDILQLHGRETVARLRDIKQKFGLQVMKAVAVETAADLVSLPGYAAAADRILFDAVAPKEATRPGGLGAVFDWHVLENLGLKLPFMVSGGLSADNVTEAVRVTRAGGVDVSSGVESAPGIKDPEMIRHFIRAARAAERDAALAIAGGR